ncbi:MAG: dolichyl-phosphate beta-glucosyltransferase [Armatimonadota bacterium]
MNHKIMNKQDDIPQISLIIPSYNEEKRLQNTINEVNKYLQDNFDLYEIIVVDDGSTDSTKNIAFEFCEKNKSIKVVSYIPNQGKGYALKQGVLASKGHMIAFSDADLSTPIDEMNKLISEIKKGYDIVIGSRAVKNSILDEHQPLYRELGGKVLNLFIQILAVPGIKDTQCGFKIYTHDVAKELFEMSFIRSWAFDVEILYLARKKGYKISEVGVKWHHCEGSKIEPFSAGLQVLKDIIRIKLHKYSM